MLVKSHMLNGQMHDQEKTGRGQMASRDLKGGAGLAIGGGKKLEIRNCFGYVEYAECSCYSFCLDAEDNSKDVDESKGPTYPVEFGYETTYHGVFRFTAIREVECQSFWRGGQATGVRGKINLMDIDNPYGPNYDPGFDPLNPAEGDVLNARIS